MANGNGGRVCPKCGTFLGQKSICPICGKTEPGKKPENEVPQNPPGQKRPGRVCPNCGTFLGQKNICPICGRPGQKNDRADGNASSSPQDYVSRVIDFVAEHPDDWDNRFNTFFQQKELEGCSFKSCYDACVRIHEIIKSMPDPDKMTGSLTMRAMTGIQEVFPGISEDRALEIVTGLSKRRTEQTAALHAIVERGVGIMNGKGADNDLAEAVRCFRQAAEQGNAKAQYNLGDCYYYGKGVDEDEAEAVKWYRKAAEQGNADAQFSLGFCYYSGKGVTRDKAEAVKWYRLAAEQGHADAQYNLGVCYKNGRGVKKDAAEARKWYRLAAEQGDPNAQFMLGECYFYDGNGVNENEAEAFKWYRLAAEQGHAEAQYMLGCCYHYGEGVDKNEAEAVEWFRKAAEQGNKEAKKRLVDIFGGAAN